MGGSKGTATLITVSAAVALAALGILLGREFDNCNTNEERLKVILKKISNLEAELSIQPLNPYLKINLIEILEPAIIFLRNMKNQEGLAIYYEARID